MVNIHTAVKTHYRNQGLFLSLMVGLAVCLVFFLLARHHVESAPWDWQSLLPTCVVLVTAIASQKPFESMMAGGLAGIIMLNPNNIMTAFSDNLSKVMGDETIIWIILVCGLMGGFIRILEISGCLNGFTEWLKKRIKSRRQSLVATALLGVVVFVDDYLSCLTVSSSMKKLTDHYHVSREKLAYLIDSSAAPMCVIVPISTWAVYFSGLLEKSQLIPPDQGMSMYLSAIPFMVYAWVAIIITFLVAFGVLGDIGYMKKAEVRAKAGQPIPDDVGTDALTIQSKSMIEVSASRQLFNFFFPIGLLIGATLFYEIDLLKGVIFTLAVTAILYYAQGILTLEMQTKAMFDGFYTMLYPLSTVIAGFFLKEVNDALGMTEYVIESVAPLVSQATYPLVVFIVLALIVFGTASSWGVFVIAIPIVLPVAQELNAHMPLVVGALLSASAFGSHACFFSDSSLLASQGAGCPPMSHAFSQLPYALIGAVATGVCFLGLGMMYAS